MSVRYWPNKRGEEMIFGSAKVVLQLTNNQEDYTHRQFKVTYTPVSTHTSILELSFLYPHNSVLMFSFSFLEGLKTWDEDGSSLQLHHVAEKVEHQLTVLEWLTSLIKCKRDSNRQETSQY